ncbi:hypothetical protein AAHC03_016876 [Spirometra sp. Aus1]
MSSLCQVFRSRGRTSPPTPSLERHRDKNYTLKAPAVNADIVAACQHYNRTSKSCVALTGGLSFQNIHALH